MPKNLEDLANHLAKNPALMKAALSGMQEGIKAEAAKQGINLHPDAIAALGKIDPAKGAGTGSPVADDYVARGVSSVLAVVKVKPSDLLAHANEAVLQMQKSRVGGH